MNIKQQLDNRPAFQKHLFERGFLITDNDYSDYLKKYPFYGNWFFTKIGSFYFYIHQELSLYMKEYNGLVLFLIGHAFNPFDMESD